MVNDEEESSDVDHHFERAKGRKGRKKPTLADME